MIIAGLAGSYATLLIVSPHTGEAWAGPYAFVTLALAVVDVLAEWRRRDQL